MVALLGALELSALRALSNSSLVDSVVIYRRALTGDGAGGQTMGTPTAVGTVNARVIPQRNNSFASDTGGRVETPDERSIYVPVGTDVRIQTDYLVHSAGGTFDVLATNADRTDAVELRLTCLERR